MDLDLLFHREVLTGLPISLLVRCDGSKPFDIGGIVYRSLELLADRSIADEIVLVPANESEAVVECPARQKGKRIRVIRGNCASDGATLCRAIEACRNPAIVLADAKLLTRTELRKALLALNEADLVVGRRPGKWIRWFIDWPIRWLFSVPVSDPLCSIKAIRKSATDGIFLETNGRFSDFEFIAKMTFRTSLLDEVPIDSREDSDVCASAGFVQNGSSSIRLLFAPTFGVPAHPAPTPHSGEASKKPVPIQLQAICNGGRPARPWGPAFPRSSFKMNHLASRRNS